MEEKIEAAVNGYGFRAQVIGVVERLLEYVGPWYA